MAIENTYISSPSLLIIVEWAETKEKNEEKQGKRERKREKLGKTQEIEKIPL